MKKFRILQVNKLYYPFTGGIEYVIREIAEGLNDRTAMQVLVCNNHKRTVNEKINGVKVCKSASIGMYGNLPISILFFLHFLKFSKRADLIQFHMPFPVGDITELLSGYRGKVIVWWHSDIVRQKKMMILYRPIMERFLKRADKIIVATAGHIEGSDYLKPYKEKCVIIPFGVSNLLEKRADIYWSKFGEKFKLDSKSCDKQKNDTLNFLFVGRLVYYKGCDILIKAFARLCFSTKVRHKLTLIGNGPLMKGLKQLVQRIGISEMVLFLDSASDEELYSQYEQCDVFVLPSVAKSEAFGLVQIEAMAFGKPVINTDLNSGVPYVSIHQLTGLTVIPENVKELEQAMKYMAENPEQRILMGQNARNRMKQEYTSNVMLQRVYNLYEQVLKE